LPKKVAPKFFYDREEEACHKRILKKWLAQERVHLVKILLKEDWNRHWLIGSGQGRCGEKQCGEIR